MPKPGQKPPRKTPNPGVKCPARKKNGDPCVRGAGWGTDHLGYGLCRFHGGTSSVGHTNGKQAQAEHEVEKYGESRVVDPGAALLEEVYRTAGLVEYLQMRIEQEGDIIETNMFGKQPSAYVKLYMAERKHLASVSKEALAANVSERQIHLMEDQAALFAGALRAILGELDLTPAQRALAPVVIRRHMLALPVTSESQAS